MKQDRMSGLAMLNLHRDYEFNIDEVINRLARKHPRQMKLIDILNDDPIHSLPSNRLNY